MIANTFHQAIPASVPLACSIVASLLISPWALAQTPDAASATPVKVDKVQPAAIKAAKPSKAAKPADAAPAAALPGTVNLQSAQQQEMVLSTRIDRIAIADPSVADALVLKPSGSAGQGSLLLFGKRSGTTNLLVWYKGQTKATSIELIVDGDDLKGTGLRATGSVLTGAAPNTLAHAQASELIRQNQPEKGGKVLIDQSVVSTSGTVQVDVKVVEFSKTAIKRIGLNLSVAKNGQFRFGTFAPGGLASFDFSNAASPIQTNQPIAGAFNLLSLTNSVFANLAILQSDGMARVLAEPSLVAQSGHSASFLAGGEFPVPVPQGLGNVTIQYKQYGIGLAVSPTVLASDRISLKVAPEASELDFTNAVTINGVAVPALITRRTDTTVELGDGETFVIGGLISKNTISNVDKVPFLGDLPIIGAFFKNLRYNKEEKELVILVTPHLVRPLASKAQLPPLPGAAAIQPDAPVWTPYVLGVVSGESLPGFSK